MTDQREPTRRSARVVLLWLVEVLRVANGETHPSVRTRHPANPMSPAPGGLGAVWRPQESTRPNQRSTRGELWPARCH